MGVMCGKCDVARECEALPFGDLECQDNAGRFVTVKIPGCGGIGGAYRATIVGIDDDGWLRVRYHCDGSLGVRINPEWIEEVPEWARS